MKVIKVMEFLFSQFFEVTAKFVLKLNCISSLTAIKRDRLALQGKGVGRDSARQSQE